MSTITVISRAEIHDAIAELSELAEQSRQAAERAVNGIGRDRHNVIRTEEYLHGQARGYERAIGVLKRHTGVVSRETA